MFKPITDLGQLLCQPVLNADTYKETHFTFEHPALTSSYSYIEARKGGDYDEIMWFGLQYIIRYYLTQQVTIAMIDEAELELTAHGVPFNRAAWMRVVTHHNGYIPVLIQALPEGLVVRQGTVLATIESLDEKIPGLASYIETLLMRVWYPTTIATRSMRWWRIIRDGLEESGTPELADFKVVDFGARGASSTETAGIGGMAHLVNFQVTDNLMGIRFAKHAYPWDGTPGFSIPATEHSVTTSWGEDEELHFFRNIIQMHGWKRGPARNPVSVVIDTYDQDRAIEMWCSTLLSELMNSNMQVVLRPDSGDPITNVPHCLDLIAKFVGFTINDKGYKVLPDFVRLIQGDGINEGTLKRIIGMLHFHRWSLDNVNFGSGGGLLTADATRDTHRFAMKASEVVIGGKTLPIRKVVKTDPSKASKAGRFHVVMNNGQIVTQSADQGSTGRDLLEDVYLSGQLCRTVCLGDVRWTAQDCR